MATKAPLELDGNPYTDIEFSQSITLSVQQRNNQGRVTSSLNVNFTATSPTTQKSDVFILDHPIKVSGCILPGLNPHGEEKKCQDNFTYVFQDNLIFCALFDGHGPVGEQVSAHCVTFSNAYFTSNTQSFIDHPKDSLIKLLEECDKSLKDTSISYELSGSTAVLVLITDKNIHTASLGDSRAVLGTIADMSFALPSPRNKFCRHYNVNRVLKPIPLTVDQKPNHEEEYLRIRKAGGVVEKIVDVLGNQLGPYRVWKAGSELPGLAMSRSIGDGIGKTIGVIATPVYHYFTIYPENDQYIVMASDGIWDVMENMEVIVFIEKFKEKCENSLISNGYPANCKNSTIARMLCEEARYRWFGLIEEEDVNIDDISCIVIDVSRRVSNSLLIKQERNVKAFQSLALGEGYEKYLENNREKVNDTE